MNDSFQFKYSGLLWGYALSVGEYVLKFRSFVSINVQDIQDEGTTCFRNVGHYSLDDITSPPRRPESSTVVHILVKFKFVINYYGAE